MKNHIWLYKRNTWSLTKSYVVINKSCFVIQQMCAAAAGYNPCLGSTPQAITCPGGELIRSPNPHSDKFAGPLAQGVWERKHGPSVPRFPRSFGSLKIEDESSI